jgi:hypothetical protein
VRRRRRSGIRGGTGPVGVAHGKESPPHALATRPQARPAMLVRGSSRRITIMMALSSDPRISG